jgi:hypothetical protein
MTVGTDARHEDSASLRRCHMGTMKGDTMTFLPLFNRALGSS